MRKLAEGVKIHSVKPEQYSAANTEYWNGQSITNASGYGWDTKDYKSADIILNVGTILGEAVTLKNSVYESTTDDPTNAVVVSSALFTDRNSANDETIEEGSLQLSGRKRYLFLKTEVQGSVPTIHFGAMGIFGVADSEPVSKTLIFDLN